MGGSNKNPEKKNEKKPGKNYELLVELLVFTCFYMCLHDFMLNVGGLQFLFGVFVDAE